MKSRPLVVYGIIAVTIASSAAQADVYTASLAPTKDGSYGFLTTDSPNGWINYFGANRDYLFVGNSSGSTYDLYNSYFYFDPSSISAPAGYKVEIVGATLNVYAASFKGIWKPQTTSAHTWQAYDVTSVWSETSNASAPTLGTGYGTASVGNSVVGWASMDITALVQSWTAGGPNKGVAIVDIKGTGYKSGGDFAAYIIGRECTNSSYLAMKPYLDVSYTLTAVPEASSLLALSAGAFALLVRRRS